jgi:hypothetical protein
VDIHFVHVRSQHQGALPVIVTHGWPGSIIEQLKIVEPRPILPPSAARRRRRSTSSSRRCPVTGSPGSRRRRGGTRSASRARGSC